MELLEKLIFLPEPVLNFLQKPILQISALTIDYWSIVHFSSGAILGYFIKKPWTAFSLLVSFEFFEMYLVSLGLINPENIYNIVWDLVIGMAGYYLVKKIKNV